MEDSYRKTVLRASQLLCSNDLEQIIYLHKIPEDTRTSPLTPLSVLIRLERQGLFSAFKPEGLKTLLETIHRSDLCYLVEEYCDRYMRYRGCCEGAKLCRHVSNIELCIAQANNVKQRILAIQQALVDFSNGQRRTPVSDKFYCDMGKSLDLLQRDIATYMVPPLVDLQQCLCAGLGRSECKSMDDKQVTEKPKDTSPGKVQNDSEIITAKSKTNNHVQTTPALGQLYRSRSLEWDNSTDYDTLDPKEDQMETAKSRISSSRGKDVNTPQRSSPTRIPIPTKARIIGSGRPYNLSSSHPSTSASRQDSSCFSPLLRRSSRFSVSSHHSDYESSLTNSDDSGCADMREITAHLGHTHLGSESSLHRPSRTSPNIYASLNPSTTDEISIYDNVYLPSQSTI